MKVGPRISNSASAWLEANFSSRGAGAEYVLECFPELYRRALHDLVGHFTAGELSLLVDTFNATMLVPQIVGQHLEISAHDSMLLDHTDGKWGADADDLLAKIRALTLFERACLEIWVKALWEQAEHDNLEEWVARLAGGA